MKLYDLDRDTFAAIKERLNLRHGDGTLVMDDDEQLMFFTAEIAPEQHLYIEFRNEWSVGLNVGVLERSREHMVTMIQKNYSGFRVYSNALRLPVDADRAVLASDDMEGEH